MAGAICRNAGLNYPEMSVPVQDAATVILVRDPRDSPQILMGQRGKGRSLHAREVRLSGRRRRRGRRKRCRALDLIRPAKERLLTETTSDGSRPVCRLRNSRTLGGNRPVPGPRWKTGPNPPKPWRGFAEQGLLPDASRTQLLLSCPLRHLDLSRRYDARFFLADAAALRFDVWMIFSRAESELRSHSVGAGRSGPRTRPALYHAARPD